jgi:hypothetical protein
MKSRSLTKPLAFGVAGVALVVGAFLFCATHCAVSSRIAGFNREADSSVASLDALLGLLSSAVERVDVARMNLLCAQGLPGADGFELNTSLAELDEMATRVQSETERHSYRFRRNPAEFENSEAFFRMLMLAVVLAEDFGVRYAPNKIGTAAEARPDDGFFADARYVFLPGLLTRRSSSAAPSPLAQAPAFSFQVSAFRSQPPLNLQPSTLNPPGGTCSSLPVLQVAVGRRLGYPLKLVTTKGHLFMRWEDAHERFNIEAAGKGINRFTDDYYRHWPLEVSPAEETAEGYLKSLTPAGELAVFLSIRGMCLREAARLPEAAEAFAAAARLAPACRGYQVMLASLQSRHGPGPPRTMPRAEQTAASHNSPNL